MLNKKIVAASAILVVAFFVVTLVFIGGGATDVVKLANGNMLIAEADRGRIIEVDPLTTKLIKEYPKLGFVTTIAIDSEGV